MSSTLVKQITFVLKKFLKEEKSFTLLDLSRELQKSSSVSLTHTELREYTKPILDDLILPIADWYAAEAVKINTVHGVVEAVVYHPEWEDVQDYVVATEAKLKIPAQTTNYVQTGLSQKLPTSITTANSGPVQIHTVNAKTTQPACCANARWCAQVKVRSDGKLEIPQKAISASGIDSGYVDIIVHPNSISIVDGVKKSSLSLRIGVSDLASANLSGKQLYVCSFNGKVIVCA